MNDKVKIAGTILAVTLAMTSSAQQQKLKAGFVYVGPIGDYGWTNAHDEARRIAEKAIPGLETLYVESVPESNPGPIIDQMIKQGANIIFATSFGFMDGTVEAAKAHPDVIFAHASGYKRLPNLATYMADFYQIYYLNGLMAGALTKTNKVAYVGAYPVPEVKRHIDAYALGVRAVNPKATVDVRWINAWYNPAAAKEATEALIADGADVFAFTEDSPTVIQVAAKKNLPSFSHYSPMKKFGPKTVVSGQMVHWDKFYVDFLKKVQAGKYTNKNLENVDYWQLLNSGAVELGATPGEPINPVFIPKLKAYKVNVDGATNAYDLVMKRLKQMSAAKPTFDPFTGPIKDRKGVLRVQAGKTMTVPELTSMEWAAPGVTGSWPNEPTK